ncbi:MAG: hypothetical protein QOI47_131 [Actinomycetota bacterium]|nr:hypothetical protein [Actinomycetota bacterium]
MLGALLLAGVVAPAHAGALLPRRTTTTSTTSTTAAPESPAAWVVVDADTGRVLASRNEHVLRRPGSTIKLLTLLTVHRLLARDDVSIPVSPLAASMPARSVGLVPGRPWRLADLTKAMLLVSANDAAVAVAEGATGSLDRFAIELQHEGTLLGLVDRPQLEDPTGLDHTFDHAGGDWISAWDLAIVGRHAMDDSRIASIARIPVLTFTDLSGRKHRFVNHNDLLHTYSGATGLKTGFTHAAGNCLVATAERGGRTMLAVLMGSSALYADAGRLLDLGFATPAATESGPRLDGRLAAPVSSTTALARGPRATPAAAATVHAPRTSMVTPVVSLAAGAAMVAVVVAASRWRRRRRT